MIYHFYDLPWFKFMNMECEPTSGAARPKLEQNQGSLSACAHAQQCFMHAQSHTPTHPHRHAHTHTHTHMRWCECGKWCKIRLDLGGCVRLNACCTARGRICIRFCRLKSRQSRLQPDSCDGSSYFNGNTATTACFASGMAISQCFGFGEQPLDLKIDQACARALKLGQNHESECEVRFQHWLQEAAMSPLWSSSNFFVLFNALPHCCRARVWPLLHQFLQCICSFW